MQLINLPVSVSSNAVLNQDGVTTLRTLNLVQGNDYTVNLSFVKTGAPYMPAINDFGFYLRNIGGSSNLVSVTSVSSGVSGYSFDLNAASPVISAALGHAKKLNLRGFLSWVDGTSIEVIEPFGVQIHNSYSGLASVSSFVSSLNTLSGAVSLVGAGAVTVTQSGQTITFSGSGAGGDLSQYALTSTLEATGSALDASISALQAQTGGYYPASNPSGFITSGSLSPFALESDLVVLQSQTGNYYQASNPSGFISTGALAPYALISTLDDAEINFDLSISALQAQTGNYYPNSNPSGFITGVNLAPYATTSALASTGSTLQAEINTLNSQTGNYYSNTNPSGFITGVPSGGNFFGTFYGNGANLTGIPGGGGISNLSGSLTGSSLSLNTSGAYNSINWNPSAVPVLLVSGGAAVVTISSVTTGAIGVIKNLANAVMTLTGSSSNIMLNNKAALGFPLMPGESLMLEGASGAWMAIGGFHLPRVVAQGVFGEVGANLILSYTLPNDAISNTHLYSVGGFINVTARATDTVGMLVTWTNEQAVVTSGYIFPMGQTSGIIASTGYYPLPTVTYGCNQGSAITVSAVTPTVGGSISFDVGAVITQLN
jgi:hypothetical protein